MVKKVTLTRDFHRIYLSLTVIWKDFTFKMKLVGVRVDSLLQV